MSSPARWSAAPYFKLRRNFPVSLLSEPRTGFFLHNWQKPFLLTHPPMVEKWIPVAGRQGRHLTGIPHHVEYKADEGQLSLHIQIQPAKMGFTSFICLASLLFISAAYGCDCSGAILEDGNTGSNQGFLPMVRNLSNLFTFQGATLVSAWRNTEESIGVMSTPTLTVLTRDFQAEAEDHSSSITQRRLALLEQITRLRLHLLLHTHPSENMNIMIESPETRPTPEN